MGRARMCIWLPIIGTICLGGGGGGDGSAPSVPEIDVTQGFAALALLLCVGLLLRERFLRAKS